MDYEFEVMKCVGCIMPHFDCVVYEDIPEMICKCPCHKCLVKVTCGYDDVCDAYSKFQDKLNSIKVYRDRMEEHETRHNKEREELDESS